MANQTVNTGHGGTLTFTNEDLAFNWTSITPGDSTVPDIDVAYLGTPTNRQYIPGDLIEDNSVTIEFQFDSAAALPVPKTKDELVVIWPKHKGEATNANLTGTGYISSITPSALATDELQTATMVWKWDGGTGSGNEPVFTPAT